MKLSTETKTHVIVTYTKSHHFITSEQEKKLRGMGIDSEMMIDNCQVKMRNIAEVLTTEKYYDTFPKKRPQPSKVFLPEKPLTLEERIVRHKNGVKQVIQALSKYTNPTAKRMIERIKSKCYQK